VFFSTTSFIFIQLFYFSGLQKAAEDFKTMIAANGLPNDIWWEGEQFQQSRRSAEVVVGQRTGVKDERTWKLKKRHEWACLSFFRQSMSGQVRRND
jgi:hypothetical protein